jgi:integrase
MILALPDTLIGLRNKALLLVGFAGAFRRSELVAIDVQDISYVQEGLRVTIRRSKTDQAAHGAVIGIPYGRGLTCPVSALKSWLEAASIAEGPVFRPIRKGAKVQAKRLTDQVVATVIKETASTVGLDPNTLSGHSLRVGLVTQAAMLGLSDRSIMAQTRHRTRAMVDRYVRDINLFRENAAGAIGL